MTKPGCALCSGSKTITSCVSKLTLKALFIRTDGVKFMSSMTSTGFGSNACSAKYQSIVNIKSDFERFISSYIPKIKFYKYKITCIITCDGVISEC